MKALIDAIDVQLTLEATKGELIEIPAAICAKTAEQYEHHDSGRGSADWAAYLRMLDAIDPGIGISFQQCGSLASPLPLWERVASAEA